jgi:hypothetical protein
MVGVARGGLVIESAFDSPGNWSPLLIGNVAGNASYFPTGGNPDGHYEISLTVPGGVARGGLGIMTGFMDLGAFEGGSVRLSLDYQYLDFATRVPPQMAIVLVQGTRAYLPTARLDPGAETSWNRVGEMEFDLDDFANSTGVPLDFSSSMRVAIVGWLENPNGVTPQTRFKIDNLRIEFVPGAGSGVALIGGVLAMSRRRR